MPSADVHRVEVLGLSGCGGDRLALMEYGDAFPGLVLSTGMIAANSASVEPAPVDIALVEGVVASGDDEERLVALRRRARHLVALGTCAVHGGPLPGRALHEVVPVDASIPGCPVEGTEVIRVMAALLHGEPPPLRHDPVCVACRLLEVPCLLATPGGTCQGPGTLSGCRTPCPSLGIGCFGCRGPAGDGEYTAPEARHGFGSGAYSRVTAAGLTRAAHLLEGRRWDEVANLAACLGGVSGTAHVLTSLRVTEAVFGVATASRTELFRDLLWRGANIAAHALHLARLASTVDPGALRRALDLRALGNRIQELVGGRAIHPVNAVVGGFGRLPSRQALTVLRGEVENGVHDVDRVVACVVSLPTAATGNAPDTFMALRPHLGYGYEGGTEVVVLDPRGRAPIPVERAAFPSGPLTAGPLARIAVNRDRLPEVGARALTALGLTFPSTDPMAAAKAHAVELAVDMEWALELVDAILADRGPEEPAPSIHPRAGSATVVTEAPRGTLLHHYTYDGDGVVREARVVTAFPYPDG